VHWPTTTSRFGIQQEGAREKSPGAFFVSASEASAVDRETSPAAVPNSTCDVAGMLVVQVIVAPDRVMPLAYADASLSGFEQDLARIRRVNPATRQALVETLAAVLDRDPTAVASVRVDLVGRRDAAAHSLDFERAARIQAGADGFEWVVAPQRATVSDAEDVDVYGWAEGVLVRFEMRSGRLCAWRQQRCAEAAAHPLVSTTPATWFEFARRNAELAARLSRRCVPD